MVHRAVFGSLERFIGILSEHTGGKWPLWISPRQVSVIPISDKFNDYAKQVAAQIFDAGFYVDIDDGSNLMKKKILEAQVAQYNYILVVGAEEAEKGLVNVRTRETVVKGTVPVAEFIADLKKQVAEFK
jgi:threonyl-tRNA synthetase